MPTTMVYVPVSAVFPDVTPDFATFCATVRSLSRTETISWCAHLNLIVANPQNHDEKCKPQYGLSIFFDAQEIGRVNAFVREHPESAVLFREQLLELVRWSCLLGEDQPGDGQTFADPETRRRFAKAALIASEIWGGRVYRDGLPMTGNQAEDLRHAMPAFRRGVLTRAPDLLLVLARGKSIYENFEREYPTADAEFHAATGLSVIQYLVLLWGISIQHANVVPANARQTSGRFSIDAVRDGLPEAMKASFDRYIRRESQTVSELREALSKTRDAPEMTSEDPFDDKPLRDRPLLRLADGSAIILDQVFYADRASVGPLFILAETLGKSPRVNTLFGAFGKAFERYVNGLLRSMYPSRPPLVDRLMLNPLGRTTDGEHEIADASLHEVADVVLFESKGVFLREDQTRRLETYEPALAKKYGASRGTKKDRAMKGAAQLGQWIGGIALGTVVPQGPSWERVRCVYPVLVPYDVTVDRPGHAQFFEEEFRRALEPDEVMRNGYVKKGVLSVAPLTVMTIDDLEHLESSVENFALIDLLKDYTTRLVSGTRPSLHDFIATVGRSNYRIKDSKELADRALDALKTVHSMVFPHLPFVMPGPMGGNGTG